jgi:hypothetical protein
MSVRGFMLFHAPVKDFSPAMRYPLWNWVLLSVAISVLAAQRESSSGNTGTGDAKLSLRPLAVMAGIVLLCQLPISLLFWRFLPQFRFIQIPFRFDAVLGALLPIAALVLLRSPTSRRSLYAVWLLFFLIPITINMAQQIRQPRWPKVAAIQRLIPRGYAGYQEYTTASVTKSEGLAPVHPMVSAIGSNASACAAAVEAWMPELRQIASTSVGACSYRVALNYYPDWHLWIDGMAATLSARPDGTTGIFVPPGRHRLVLKFVRPRWPALAGIAVSCAACCLVVILLYAGKRERLFVGNHGAVG